MALRSREFFVSRICRGVSHLVQSNLANAASPIGERVNCDLSPQRRAEATFAFLAPDEAIHTVFRGEMDCFAEPVIGRRLRRPVRSQ